MVLIQQMTQFLQFTVIFVDFFRILNSTRLSTPSPPAAGSSHSTHLRNRARLRLANTLNSSPPAAGSRHSTHLRNRARLRRAHTPNSSPPAAGCCHLPHLRNRARLRRQILQSEPACGGQPSLNKSQKSSPPAAGKYSKSEPACGGLPSLDTSQKSSPPAAGQYSKFKPSKQLFA